MFSAICFFFDASTLRVRHFLLCNIVLLQVSSAVAPMFRPPVAAVKLDLGMMKPSNTFLTQMQSARLPKGKKKKGELKSGFLSDRGGASGSRPHEVAGQSVLASEMVAKAFASAGRRISVEGRQ